jgi:ureidoglycolate hydrolase
MSQNSLSLSQMQLIVLDFLEKHPINGQKHPIRTAKYPVKVAKNPAKTRKLPLQDRYHIIGEPWVKLHAAILHESLEPAETVKIILQN